MNFSHLYLSPLEQCNLDCKICYTPKTKEQLTEAQLLDFIDRYQEFLNFKDKSLESVTLCGGEVFLLPWITKFINQVTQKKIIVEIVTNGTINLLKQLNYPNLINLIVSLDGLEKSHDLNRGIGSFKKTWQFLKKADQLGFHFEIFSVVSQQNFDHIDQFEGFLAEELGFLPKITYHPRKPKAYLKAHPSSNKTGQINGFEFLTFEQTKHLAKTKKIFPPLNLGCHQLALMSDANVYACCEGIKPLGNINTPIDLLIENYQKRIEIPEGFPSHCQGCVEPDFVCGIGRTYAKITS